MKSSNSQQSHSSGLADGVILHGVDFSGADSGGAAKIRVITRDMSSLRTPVESMGRLDRRGLVRAILASREDTRAHVWRVDAPMSIPAEIVREFGLANDWMAVARWMQGLASPRLWRGAVRERTRREPRRACDIAMNTPMSPLNLRVFKQTWTFMCEVLLPLAEEGIRIEPCLPGTSGDVVVCEGCPASILHLKGWPKRGYKGAGDPPMKVRAEIIRLLSDSKVSIPPQIVSEAIQDEEGDMLDAIILTMPTVAAVVPEVAMVEGWVY